MFTPANLFASILFGSIGLAAFIYGKKQQVLAPLLLGLALMVYPYFISQTWLMYSLGAVLTVCLFVFRGG